MSLSLLLACGGPPSSTCGASIDDTVPAASALSPDGLLYVASTGTEAIRAMSSVGSNSTDWVPCGMREDVRCGLWDVGVR